MKLKAKLNGIPCELEISDDQFAALKTFADPKDLNQKEAAKFCRVSAPTFRKWRVAKNSNGRFSVSELTKRMEAESLQPKTRSTKKKKSKT
ncbi:MAG: hypothetical protein JWM68_3770 [Verrucomicrobiales bacterium]|nr:hypothetical protein [Verrucomicrobiales bacterium]